MNKVEYNNIRQRQLEIDNTAVAVGDVISRVNNTGDLETYLRVASRTWVKFYSKNSSTFAKKGGGPRNGWIVVDLWATIEEVGKHSSIEYVYNTNQFRFAVPFDTSANFTHAKAWATCLWVHYHSLRHDWSAKSCK